MKLYMVVIGGKPDGRHTEQHDVFFGVASSLKDLVPKLNLFWPALAGKMHIDSWREVCKVEDYEISVVPKMESTAPSDAKLYFVNLGGYKPQDMEEYHYKQLVVADSLAEATKKAKSSTFWKHHDSAHIDDKYGIDVDDIYEIHDLLDEEFKTSYALNISPTDGTTPEDSLAVGYLKINSIA